MCYLHSTAVLWICVQHWVSQIWVSVPSLCLWCCCNATPWNPAQFCAGLLDLSVLLPLLSDPLFIFTDLALCYDLVEETVDVVGIGPWKYDWLECLGEGWYKRVNLLGASMHFRAPTFTFSDLPSLITSSPKLAKCCAGLHARMSYFMDLAFIWISWKSKWKEKCSYHNSYGHWAVHGLEGSCGDQACVAFKLLFVDLPSF